VVLALAHAHPGLRHHRRPAAAAIVAVVCESRRIDEADRRKKEYIKPIN
jgi:hypothetical protein